MVVVDHQGSNASLKNSAKKSAMKAVPKAGTADLLITPAGPATTSPKNILIDTSPDLRSQALREKINRVDAVLYTHPHADHIHGIDELRSFNFLSKNRISLYGNEWTTNELYLKFPYIFTPPNKIEGGGVPQLDLIQIQADRESTGKSQELAGRSVCGAHLRFGDLVIEAIPLRHGSKEVLSYKFNTLSTDPLASTEHGKTSKNSGRLRSVAYVVDTSYIPQESISKLQGVDVLVMDCIRLKAHHTHLNLEQALKVVQEVQPKVTYLTHMGHDFEYEEWSEKLSKKDFAGFFSGNIQGDVHLAFDGLKIQIE